MDAMHDRGHGPRDLTASTILGGSMNDHNPDTHADMTHGARPDAGVHLPEHTEHAAAGHDPDTHAAAGHDMHAAGHDRHDGHSVAMFRDKFWLSLALTIPVVLLSPDVARMARLHDPGDPGHRVRARRSSARSSSSTAGWSSSAGPRASWRDRQPGMMTLISLAIVVAFVTSWAGTLGLFEVEIWWELATLITIMLLGHWLEMRSIAQARGALAALAELLPDTAERVTADGHRGRSRSRRSRSATSCSCVPVRACPADGIVDGGAADVDESMITGESRAVPKAARRHGRRRHRRGRRLAPGRGHGDGRRHGALGDHADGRRSPGVRLARPGARRPGGRPPVLRRARCGRDHARRSGGCSAIRRVRWSGRRRSSSSPARTRLASRSRSSSRSRPRSAPGTGCSSRTGSPSSGRATLDMVLFDKTGTLTEGEPVLVDVAATASRTRCCSARGGRRGRLGAPARAGDRARRPRRGHRSSARAPTSRPWPVAAPRRVVDGRTDRRRWSAAARRARPRPPLPMSATDVGPRRAGRSCTWSPMARRRRARASRTRSGRSRPRRSTHSTRIGVRVAMITGDSQAVADSVARRLGIDEVAAQVLPGRQGGRGDAVPGRAAARSRWSATASTTRRPSPRPTSGIAIGAGTDVAVESAGIVLVRSDPRDVVGAIELSRATYRKMVQNLVWATGYNLVAIPVAMGLLVPWGIDLPMAVGRHRDEPVDDHRGGQRAAAATARPPASASRAEREPRSAISRAGRVEQCGARRRRDTTSSTSCGSNGSQPRSHEGYPLAVAIGSDGSPVAAVRWVLQSARSALVLGGGRGRLGPSVDPACDGRFVTDFGGDPHLSSRAPATAVVKSAGQRLG